VPSKRGCEQFAQSLARLAHRSGVSGDRRIPHARAISVGKVPRGQIITIGTAWHEMHVQMTRALAESDRVHTVHAECPFHARGHTSMQHTEAGSIIVRKIRHPTDMGHCIEPEPSSKRTWLWMMNHEESAVGPEHLPCGARRLVLLTDGTTRGGCVRH